MRADARVKIGWCASNVEKRKAELQTGCPHPLEVLTTFAGSREDEAALHRDFADLRVQGEWFQYEEPLVSFVARKVKAVRDTKRKAPGAGFIQCAAAVGLGAEDPNPFHFGLAKEFGASISIKPLPLDRTDVERLHASGASCIAPINAQAIPPENRDVLLVVHVHDDKTQQIAVRLEPKAIDLLIEILGGVADAARLDAPTVAAGA